VLAVAVIVNRILVRSLRRAYWRRVDIAAEVQGAVELARVQRQKTLVTLLESVVRYTVFGTAIVLALSVATDGRAVAVLGASIVVLVGFGLQRMLGDFVAGALLLFEGHFAVGDVVTVHPNDVTGMVEEFTLRMTALRTLGGDRVVILNGSITNVTRWSHGQRAWRIELVVDAENGPGVIERVCDIDRLRGDAPWVQAPLITSVADVGRGQAYVTLQLVASPEHEALVMAFAQRLEHATTDLVHGPVTTYPFDQESWERWRAEIVDRALA
jgi:hypothetical protein